MCGMWLGRENGVARTPPLVYYGSSLLPLDEKRTFCLFDSVDLEEMGVLVYIGKLVVFTPDFKQDFSPETSLVGDLHIFICKKFRF